MVIKEALICYLSEFGYNGFYYPSRERGIIKQNSEYEVLPWISGNQDNLSAIKVEKKNILLLTLSLCGYLKQTCQRIYNVKEPERKINQP